MTDWLISEVPDDVESAVLDDQALGALTQSRGESEPSEPALAISINDIVIHETRKWFGGAAIRLDILVVHGNAATAAEDGWYTCTTRVFPDVHDGQRLNTDGMLLFLGWPRHFLDLFIIASRDTKDAEELGDLLRERLATDDTQSTVGRIAGLVAAPEAMVVAAAAGAALKVGSLAFDLVGAVTSRSVGVYQRSWLEHADAFGLGRHPAGEADSIRAGDFSFWLNVRRDVAA
jgi:hypothetical protein